MKLVLAFILAFGLGAMARWLGVPSPAPPRLTGALLVVAVTVGYIAADRFMEARAAKASEQVEEREGT